MARDLPKPRTRALMAQETRDRIIAAARQTFDAWGYEAADMRLIAANAGHSTGAIFAHFGGKAELYRTIYGHDPISPELGRRLLSRLVELGHGTVESLTGQEVAA